MSAATLTFARIGDLHLTRAAEHNFADLLVIVAQLHRPKIVANRGGGP
jgi:hypothetical protein